MKRGWGWALLLGAANAVAQAPPVDEDERWIERYMASAPAAAAPAAAAADGAALAFAALGQHRGRSVRVLLRDGRERRGVVERADGEVAELSAAVKGGRFSYRLERSQVLRIQLEGAP
jgi:hypothetical protein